MEDERVVPVPVLVYKAEVWRHLGFWGNVRRLPRPVLKSLRAGRLLVSLMLERFVQLGRCSSRGLGDSMRNINKK